MMKKTSVLLVNLGTPDNPGVTGVFKYLIPFLNDPRVIDLPLLLRFLLVNLIIIPFRVRKSSRRYQKIWTEEGSPLLVYTLKLQQKLQVALGDDTSVHMAMRYGNPSIKSVLNTIRRENPSNIIIIPLFPQYASSTNGSIIELALKVIKSWNTIPSIKFIHDFSSHKGFIRAFAEKLLRYNPEKYDHILFSFHSLPIRHVKRIHPQVEESHCECIRVMPDHGHLCYKALCYATARKIAEAANIESGRYSVCFQSRFSKNWLSPFTEETIIKKASEGVKSILVVAPSFVTDGLETISDIGMDALNLFRENGGERLQLVESLNDSALWVEALKDMILKENSE